MSQARDNVFPTRQMEQIYKAKEKGAKKGTLRDDREKDILLLVSRIHCFELVIVPGYDLLKKKRDALKKRFHSLASKIYNVSQRSGM